MKNKKTKAILSLTGYLLMLIAICVASVFVFQSAYYDLVYVSGSSMSPTLNGGAGENDADGDLVDFGIVDGHKSAINHIKRFDIISTYYPDDYNSQGVLLTTAKRKIKRVIGMPGETFTIKDGLLKVKKGDEYEHIPYKFKVVETTVKDVEDMTLGQDEYWVLGDNRGNSLDCAVINKPINKKNIAGVLVAIQGRATLRFKCYQCRACGKKFNSHPGYCTGCGSSAIAPQYALTNKKYCWPRYF